MITVSFRTGLHPTGFFGQRTGRLHAEFTYGISASPLSGMFSAVTTTGYIFSGVIIHNHLMAGGWKFEIVIHK
jgi:hypothetical protein